MFDLKRNTNILLCIIAITAFTTLISATPITTYLNRSNEILGISGDFASVTIEGSGTTITFTVDANELLLGTGTNFGIQEFGFNTSLTLSEDDFSLPSGWEVKLGNKNISSFGLFYADESGKGNTRQDPLIFTVTNSSITDESQFFVANSGGSHYVAHIAGFTAPNGKTSAYFADGSAIPEPITPILLGFGLLSLVGVKRKK